MTALCRALLLAAFLPHLGCKQPDSASNSSAPAPVTAPPWFEDVTDRAGITFVHDTGPPTPDYFLPQVMGSGCAVFDANGDGLMDLYFVQNAGPNGAKNCLYRQRADGSFADVSAGSGLDVSGYGMGVAVGDVNNDGHPDVLVTEFGNTRLFLNLGAGKFRDISRQAGIDNPLWGTSAAFFDYDRDGWLDLIIVNYLDYDRALTCGSRGGKLDFCGPKTFPGSVSRFYRNLGRQAGAGEAKFEDVTLKTGLGTTKGKGLGVLCADFDGDGWPDIFAANDMTSNHLWINQRSGTFRDEAVRRGVAYTGSAAAAANMGIAWSDIDGNGLPDLFVSHLMQETHTLWKQEPRGAFLDATGPAGLLAIRRTTGFGTAFADFDCDCWPDLAIVNGGVVRNQDADTNAQFWQQYAQRNQLLANDRQGRFRDISPANPALCGDPNVGRGLAVVDYDNDGALDLVVTSTAGRARLLRNVAGARGHWLSIRATIPDLKRDAYGAEVTVRVGGRAHFGLVNPAYSYCSSNDVRCHFGLGAAASFDAVEVRWPDGTVEEFPGGTADRAMELQKGAGRKLANRLAK